MTTRENVNATTEARIAAGRSTAAISRHDAALQRYLGSMQHASLAGSAPADDPEYPPAGRVPLLREIQTIPPTVSPAKTSPDPAVARLGGALSLITARPSGAASVVSAPLRRTVAFER